MVVIERQTFKVSDLLTEKRVLLLDGVQDPGNLGSILRSMVAFDIKTLCVTDDCVDVFHPKAVNASSGALLILLFITKSIGKTGLKHPRFLR